MSTTTDKWRVAEQKAHATSKMANTLAKALVKRFGRRWQFVDFLGKQKHESAGIVNLLAIRKCGKPPLLSGLKRLDLLDIVIIQAKGGSASKPTKDERARLRSVAEYHRAKKVVLFTWKKSGKPEYHLLNEKNEWDKQDDDGRSLFR